MYLSLGQYVHPNLPIVPFKLCIDEQMVTKLKISSKLGNQYKPTFKGVVEVPIQK